jgi:hypothetical protein
LEALEERLNKEKSEIVFDRSKWLHKALLICSLVRVMSALTLNEIALYIDIFGVVLSNDDLRQALFMLEKLGLVAIVARSRQRFYVSRGSVDYIKWGVRRDQLDLSRFEMDVVRHYEAADKKRFRAIQEARV